MICEWSLHDKNVITIDRQLYIASIAIVAIYSMNIARHISINLKFLSKYRMAQIFEGAKFDGAKFDEWSSQGF